MPGKATLAAAVLGLAILQVILPSLLDLVVTLAVGGACAWAGYRAGQASA